MTMAMEKEEVMRMFTRTVRNVRDILGQKKPLTMLGRTPKPDAVLNWVLDEVWRRLSSRQVPELPPERPLSAERVVLSLTARGVAKDRIRYHDGAFRVNLDHAQYEIRREGGSFCARYVLNGTAHCWMHFPLGPEEFASFLPAFDACVPEMQQGALPLMDDLREHQREMQKQEMIRLIRRTTRKAAGRPGPHF